MFYRANLIIWLFELLPKCNENNDLYLEQIAPVAQRPASYLVLKYVRRVYKCKTDQKILTVPAASNVFEQSSVDVSLLAGMLVDKFVYHLPLYRQHQRILQAGIQVSRSSLTNWTGRAIDLLSLIVDAHAKHQLQSKVLAMDETPIKAGKIKKGKMRQAYLWPIYSEDDEVVFHYSEDRAHHHVTQWLEGFSGTLLSDGYQAYAAYAEHNKAVTNAQCWNHTRRYFERAKDIEATASGEALALMGVLYQHEQIIRDQKLSGEEKLNYRTKHSEPIVHAFWVWCDQQCQRLELLPSNPLSKALTYAKNRREGLQVFLTNPDVAIDTNHLERTLRVIQMGRKNWLFCWTEIGAKRVAIIQSLLVTCKLHGVDPYEYLVDVLQRVNSITRLVE